MTCSEKPFAIPCKIVQIVYIQTAFCTTILCFPTKLRSTTMFSNFISHVIKFVSAFFHLQRICDNFSIVMWTFTNFYQLFNKVNPQIELAPRWQTFTSPAQAVESPCVDQSGINSVSE